MQPQKESQPAHEELLRTLLQKPKKFGQIITPQIPTRNVIAPTGEVKPSADLVFKYPALKYREIAAQNAYIHWSNLKYDAELEPVYSSNKNQHKQLRTSNVRLRNIQVKQAVSQNVSPSRNNSLSQKQQSSQYPDLLKVFSELRTTSQEVHEIENMNAQSMKSPAYSNKNWQEQLLHSSANKEDLQQQQSSSEKTDRHQFQNINSNRQNNQGGATHYKSQSTISQTKLKQQLIEFDESPRAKVVQSVYHPLDISVQARAMFSPHTTNRKILHKDFFVQNYGHGMNEFLLEKKKLSLQQSDLGVANMTGSAGKNSSLHRSPVSVEEEALRDSTRKTGNISSSAPKQDQVFQQQNKNSMILSNFFSKLQQSRRKQSLSTTHINGQYLDNREQQQREELFIQRVMSKFVTGGLEGIGALELVLFRKIIEGRQHYMQDIQGRSIDQVLNSIEQLCRQKERQNKLAVTYGKEQTSEKLKQFFEPACSREQIELIQFKSAQSQQNFHTRHAIQSMHQQQSIENATTAQQSPLSADTQLIKTPALSSAQSFFKSSRREGFQQQISKIVNQSTRKGAAKYMQKKNSFQEFAKDTVIQKYVENMLNTDQNKDKLVTGAVMQQIKPDYLKRISKIDKIKNLATLNYTPKQIQKKLQDTAKDDDYSIFQIKNELKQSMISSKNKEQNSMRHRLDQDKSLGYIKTLNTNEEGSMPYFTPQLGTGETVQDRCTIQSGSCEEQNTFLHFN